MTTRANSLRSCRECPVVTDCMASVIRHGPLLFGCDGLREWWQYEDGCSDSRTAAGHIPLRVKLAEYVRHNTGFTAADAATAIGHHRNAMFRAPHTLVERGVLKRTQLPREGRGNPAFLYQVTGSKAGEYLAGPEKELGHVR